MTLASFGEIEMAPSIVIRNVKKVTQFGKLNISACWVLLAGMKVSKLNHPILAITARSKAEGLNFSIQCGSRDRYIKSFYL